MASVARFLFQDGSEYNNIKVLYCKQGGVISSLTRQEVGCRKILNLKINTTPKKSLTLSQQDQSTLFNKCLQCSKLYVSFVNYYYYFYIDKSFQFLDLGL